MFSKTLAALKVVEEAITEELEALWVPYDPATGTGAVHWHAAGASILGNLQQDIARVREDMEKRQAPIDAAALAEAEAAKIAAEAPAPEPEPVPVPPPPPAPEPEVIPEPPAPEVPAPTEETVNA